MARGSQTADGTGEAVARPAPDGATEKAGGSREATENALIEAALDLLRERGVLAGMNLREIADRAGVHRALVYHYFGSRQELLRAAAKRETSRPREGFDDQDEMGVADWLTSMLASSFDYKEAIRLNMLLVLDHDETVRTLTTRRAVMERLSAEGSAGVLVPDDPEAVYAAFASLSYGFPLFAEHFAAELGCEPEDLERRLLKVVEAMFRAVQHDPPG